MRFSCWLGPFLVLFVAVSASAQSRDIVVEATMRTEKRLALVIGNAAYRSSPLPNPVNDARAITTTLKGAGFEVMTYENLDRSAMRRAIILFGDRLRGGGVGFFYFAGHGVQVSGRNYLVPVDASIHSEAEVEVEAVDVASVLARMDTAQNRVNIVVLDACRNNPFGRGFRSASLGLASIDAPSETIISYATAPGRVAADGEGEHGLYTGELVKAMQIPGLKIEDVFKRVRASVQQRSNSQQVPWESSSLVGDFLFQLPRIGAPTPPPAPKIEIREEARHEVGSLSRRCVPALDHGSGRSRRPGAARSP